MVLCWDWCNRRRLALLIALLIICSLFILLFEEYIEDSVAKANQLWRRSPITPDLPIGQTAMPPPLCPPNSLNKTEPAMISEQCQRCSDFQLNALQSEHCRETGYFDTYTCNGSDSGGAGTNHTIYRPCLSRSRSRDTATLYAFTFFCIFCSLLSGLCVRWRQQLLERRAFSTNYSYSRLAATAGDG